MHALFFVSIGKILPTKKALPITIFISILSSLVCSVHSPRIYEGIDESNNRVVYLVCEKEISLSGIRQLSKCLYQGL